MVLARASARTATLEHFVWSTIPAAAELTGVAVPHMDYKARVDARVRDELPELFAKTTFLSVGFYSSNLAFFPLMKPFEVVSLLRLTTSAVHVHCADSRSCVFSRAAASTSGCSRRGRRPPSPTRATWR